MKKTVTEKQKIKMKMKNKTQEAVVYSFFMSCPDIACTPWQVHRFLFFGTMIPITSTRRALCNLTRAGLLKKMEHTVDGPLGSPNHLWTLNTQHTHVRIMND